MAKVRVINSERITIAEYRARFMKYKSLVWIFAWQEIKTQYAQTFLGIFWVVLRPLVILSVFTVLFSSLLRIRTAEPYYLFAFSGMIAWNLFSQIVAIASPSITQRQELIRKMYFPKVILPLSKTLIAGVEALVSMTMFFVLLIYAHYPLTWSILLLPLFIFLNVCCGLAVAFWMNVLNIRYRDLNQIVQPLISIGIWFTPVFFPTTIIPDRYHFFLYLNPMAGVIAGYRCALLGEQFPGLYYWVSFGFLLLLLAAGLRYLIYIEDDIVDHV